MIKAKELRIGNNFQDDEGNILTCFGVAPVDDSDQFNIWYGNELGFILLEEEAEPIPLTEEWLIKFGLQHKSFSFDHECLHKDINVGYNGDDFINNQISFLYKKKVWFKIHYVHSLQNLYFALTGEELTIKETVKCLGGCGNKVSSAEILFCSNCENQQ